MKRTIILLTWAVLMSSGLAQEFDPYLDGWHFSNWGETGSNCIDSCDFSWELFRQTYLGVNPTHDCVTAHFDCAFYEIFKNCASGGNCGGMSLLGLSLFKYGGYFGFCSPAKFYTGVVGPDREDLHRAINIMQARQFSAPGVQNFIDRSNAGELNNAEAAYADIKECLAKNDYPVISIANTFWGESAHTLIPYRLEQSGGTKYIYVWDPNNPYDKDPSRYAPGSTSNRIVVNSAIDWSYATGDGSTTYSGLGAGGWCFCIPMSLVRPKARHPLAMDMLITGLMTFFVSGPGCAVSQIEDEDGHRFYKSEMDIQTQRNNIENDPDKKIVDMVRWPWYGQFQRNKDGRQNLPGELYFIRTHRGQAKDLKIVFYGQSYDAVIACQTDLIKIKSVASSPGKDVIKLQHLSTASQTVAIETRAMQRTVAVEQLRSDISGENWRSLNVSNLKVNQNQPVQIRAIGDLEAVHVTSPQTETVFDLEIQQRMEGSVQTKQIRQIRVPSGQSLRIAPENWNDLNKTDIKPEVLQLKQRK
jgi:hypothetical protein